jgi:hypothetical protein
VSPPYPNLAFASKVQSVSSDFIFPWNFVGSILANNTGLIVSAGGNSTFFVSFMLASLATDDVRLRFLGGSLTSEALL